MDNSEKDDKQVVLFLRIPKEVKEKIEDRAAKTNRSVNQMALTLIQMGLRALDQEPDSKE